MTEIWIIYSDFGYEGLSEVYGAYSSEAKAKQAALDRYNGNAEYANQLECQCIQIDCPPN